MLIKAILLLLPMVSPAEIKLTFNINAHNIVKLEYTGANIDVISDKERQTFGIGDESLKDAAEVYSGKRPDDVFVRSPTPWNDLYSTYHWPRVLRIVKPVNIRILNSSSVPVSIFSREFINNSSLKAILDTSITVDVSDTVETTWPVNDELEAGQKIIHTVKTNGNEADTFFFETKWGEDVTKAITYKIGPTNKTQIELEPHQKVVANLTAVRVSADVEVEYIAKLDGVVACNYGHKYQGHHFWAYDINEVLDAAHLPKQKQFREVVRIQFYSDGKVIVSDVQTLKPMLEIVAEII